MIKEIEEFLKRSHDHSPACEKYALKVSKARNKLELFDTGLEIQCIEYLCNAIDDGWGMEIADIARIFGAYINGRHIHKGDYTSVLYASYDGDVDGDKTVMCFLGCDVDLHIPEQWRMCKVFACESRIRIHGKGTVIVEHQGNNTEIERVS